MIPKFLAPEGYEWRRIEKDFGHEPVSVWVLGKVLDPNDPWSDKYMTRRETGPDFAPLEYVIESMFNDVFDASFLVKIILEQRIPAKVLNA